MGYLGTCSMQLQVPWVQSRKTMVCWECNRVLDTHCICGIFSANIVLIDSWLVICNHQPSISHQLHKSRQHNILLFWTISQVSRTSCVTLIPWSWCFPCNECQHLLAHQHRGPDQSVPWQPTQKQHIDAVQWRIIKEGGMNSKHTLWPPSFSPIILRLMDSAKICAQVVDARAY